MFPMFYFPLVATRGIRCAPASFVDKLLEGNIQAAASYANRWAEGMPGGGEAAWLLRLHADMQATLGIGDEAEEQYRRSQKLIRSSRQSIRAASCRNAGWQALFRHRLATALSCFARVADESDIDPLQRADAQFGLVCALHEVGHSREATRALDELAARVDEGGAQADDGGAQRDGWRELIVTLRYDIAVQRELRTSSGLVDHVYWQTDSFDDTSSLGIDPSDALSLHEIAALQVRTPLLRQRIDLLRALRALTRGERSAIDAVQRHLAWAHQHGLHEYCRTTRLEATLVAIVCKAPQLADLMLEPLQHGDHVASTGHRQIEYLYCMAKSRQAEGRSRESMQFYSRYALVATQCIRADAHAIAPLVRRSLRQSSQLDDVAARLPAKYRRAYRYMQENLERVDLSVREVAVEIGVTERALQTAFKNFLGLSPTELIRRQRMEGIRAELVDDEFSSDRSILEAANRWGVQNRSTLVAGYRKQFQEAPSETIER